MSYGGAIEWDVLVLKAAREHFGIRSRVVPSFITQEDKKVFLAQLLNDARSINPREPQEIRRNAVDVNEKVYYNKEARILRPSKSSAAQKVPRATTTKTR